MMENFEEVMNKYLKGELYGEFVTNRGHVLCGGMIKEKSEYNGKTHYRCGSHWYDAEGYEVSWIDVRTGDYIEKFNEYDPSKKRYTYIKYEDYKTEGQHGLIKMIGESPSFKVYYDHGYAIRFHQVCEHISYRFDDGEEYNLERRCLYGDSNPYILTLGFSYVSCFAIITEEEYNAIVDTLKEERIVDKIERPESKYCTYILDEKHSKKDKIKFIPDKVRDLYLVRELEYREDLGTYTVKDPELLEKVKPVIVKVDKKKYSHFEYVEEESDFTKAVYKRKWDDTILKEDEETGFTIIDADRGW